MLYVTTLSNTLNAFLIPHIEMLIEKGHEVSIACSIEQPLKPYFNDRNIKVYQVLFSRQPLSKQNILSYKMLKKIIKENGIEIIHTHTPVASLITRIVCKNMNVKVFYTAHGFHFYRGAPKLNWLVYYPLEKYLSRFTDTILTINQEDYQIASQKFHSKKVYLINGVGIPIEKYKKIQINTMRKKAELGIKDKKTKIILSVGELNRNKNHTMVIEALKQFKDKNFKYFICGVGSLDYALKEKIKNSDLEEKVVLLGYRTDVLEIMKISDLFVFPSKREGLPVSVMEAMSIGLPVVASNIRGNMDLIQDNIAGKLFDVNALTELTEILQLFFSGDMPLDIYSNNASMSIQNYSKEKVAHQIADIYEI
ncbi:glycosyltransferase family 4 protein [Enterococcus faecium]|uniref:glycosyltransferase family 4 protein n=1 Tax=Enterococcus faecium TaxID=1352 RepID=UPI002115822E|nr:glycosyltransferase family 4 protein [Enterococcus faecium]